MGELFAGRYELVDPLGHGGTGGGGLGSVWRAWDHKRQEYIAAKVLQHADAAALLRFVREQSYVVDHPHVVVPAGWAGEGDRVLFTMRMVCGGSTETLLDAYGTLPPEWVAVLLDQLLSALVALHALGIVHRDLKPANLLLEPTGSELPQLCVSDFGIATQLGQPRLTRASRFVGTPGYLAPEQASGAEPDPRQDLFASGAVAAELLRGRSPATADGVPAPLEPDAPLGVPAPLWGVLRRLAAPDPDDRPADAVQARQELADSGSLPADWAGGGGGGAGVQVADHTPPFPADWGPEGPTGEPRILVREGTGIPATVFHRRTEAPEPESAEAAEAAQVGGAAVEAAPAAAAAAEPVEVAGPPELEELEELPEVVEAPEPDLEPEHEPLDTELPTLQPSAAADLAPAEEEPEEDYEAAYEAEFQPAREPGHGSVPEPGLQPEPEHDRMPEPDLQPERRLMAEPEGQPAPEHAHDRTRDPEQGRAADPGRQPTAEQMREPERGRMAEAGRQPAADHVHDRTRESEHDRAPEPGLEPAYEPEPSFRSETPVEDLLADTPPPARPEPRQPRPQQEQPARGPWATEPEWSAEPPAHEPAAERERPEPRPPVPSRFATPAPERRPPRRPTRQGPQPRPPRPAADTPRRERPRDQAPQTGPVWAGDRPSASPPQQPPRRRSRRVVRAVALFATVLGAMLLLAAVALIYFR